MTDMILRGKYAEAVVYADIVEEKAAEQIRRMCDYEFTAGAKIRIMPDVHAGKGCTIGTTMTVTDKVVPNIVGVDIGCGMYTVELAEREIDLASMDEAAHGIPSGRDVWEEKRESFDLTSLACFRELKEPARLEKSIGTLGGGNHFIEIDRASDGRLFLVIHSGSRNLGKQVAEYYQSLAVRLNEGWEDTPKKRAEVIASLKAAGREREIQSALAELKAAKRERSVPDDLCYVYGEALQNYLHDVNICQAFAVRNRER
ncbi:MAG: RtcB family protein, partial [Clostridia bacterium]|nr:RtcB family protein [Clostridia bacterium]